MHARTVCALALSLSALAGGAGTASAEGQVNLYSSRHYDTDERLYSDFEKQTGITINRIEAGADELIERMKAEGVNSPADVLITVDAGRLYRAEQEGLFQPVESEVLERRVPDYLQHPGNLWFGFSQRSRIIFYDREDVQDPPQTYRDLADPRYKGKVCTRSSSNIYMLSLMAALIEHEGKETAREWAEGVKANFARDPQGGDTDQLKAIVSGECDIVLSNTYYFARALDENADWLEGGKDRIGWVFPNQSTTGAHMNISGAGVAANAPNRENAIRFLEYLASDSAQRYFSRGNQEYPAVPGVALSETLAQLGLFRQDDINLSLLGENQALAQQIYDGAGYE
jgi:iron(III) transport system substrate-binding protein